MRNTVILSLLILIFAVWLHAQEGDPGVDGWVSGKMYPPTIEGCLERHGFYNRLVGKDGTVYNLTHDTGLSRFVGHEVEISGKPTIITLDTTMVQAASSAEELSALEVETVKDLSDTCRAAQR